MTGTPAVPGPHTDPDAELPETVAFHIKWLRRHNEVSNNDAAYQADNRQSADYLERLLGVAHRLAERLTAAETEAADARLDAEGWERTAKAAETERDALRDAARGIWKALIAVQPALSLPYPDDPRWTPWSRWIERPLRALGALVAPDPNPTDTGDPT